MPQPDDRQQEDLDTLTQHVLDHYEDPYHRGECSAAATHSLRRESPLCGDWVRVDLAISAEGRVKEAWFDAAGCVLSQAAASMLMEKIEGLTLQQVQQFSAAQMLEMVGAGVLPSRQKCCLLPWRVLQGAINAPLTGDAYDNQGEPPQFGGPSLEEEA